MILAVEKMDIEQFPSNIPEVTVFILKGPFTLATMFPYQSALREPGVTGAIVDLSGVPYMDSAGLGVLLGQWAHAQRVAHKFGLSGILPRVRTILEITHTDKILPIFATVAEAEAAFTARPA